MKDLTIILAEELVKELYDLAQTTDDVKRAYVMASYMLEELYVLQAKENN
jgi:hypothetical protein